MHLSRCFHLDPDVHSPPYELAQVAAIERGRIPDGRLWGSAGGGPCASSFLFRVRVPNVKQSGIVASRVEKV